jgi:hypothetical protein
LRSDRLTDRDVAFLLELVKRYAEDRAPRRARGEVNVKRHRRLRTRAHALLFSVFALSLNLPPLFAWANPIEIAGVRFADHTWGTTYDAATQCPPSPSYWYSWGSCHGIGTGTTVPCRRVGPESDSWEDRILG